MEKVEFRFLQLVVSHVSGDRVTLGLIHWDGSQLRVAHSFSHLAFCEAERRDIVKRTVSAKLRRAEKQAREVQQKGGFMYGLEHLVPVREGLGSSLFWTPIQVSQTENPAAHFEALKTQARLREETRPESAPVTNKELAQRLLTEGHWLEEETPDRIRLSNKVRRLQTFTAPVSWKNGRWHHAVPFSLDGLDESSMAKRARELVGIVQLCVPTEDVPVPVLVYPDAPKLAAIAKQEAEIVQESLAERNVQIITAKRMAGGVSLDPVVEHIRADVLSHGDAEE